MRRSLSRFRLSCHPLEIEIGRHKGIDREYRICQLCNVETEDEYHFLLRCPAWTYLRKRYLPEIFKFYVHPSRHKFYRLMSSKDTHVIKTLALFLYHAFKVKEQLL